MSWKAQKSLERIFNTFKRLKTNIYANDIDALKELNNELLKQQKQYATDNILFAKLLCAVLHTEMNHYGGIQPAIKKVDEILKKPLDYHLQWLVSSLNTCDINNFLESKGYEFGTYKDQSGIIKANEKEFIEKLKSNWDYFKVEKAFLNTINGFIKDIDNYN